MGRSRYLRAVHPGPSGGVDPERPEELLECLAGVAERIGRPAVLVAMDDLSAIAVSRIAPVLQDRFRIPHQPDGLPARVADKAELSRLCARWEIPHPETVIPESPAEAAEAAWRLGLPVVAKWSRPWLLPAGAGLRSTTLVHTAAEARRLYERSAQAGSPLLLQRFLPAGPDTDWFFHGCFTRGGHPLLVGSGRKELSWPVRTGLTAMGRWLPDPAVEEAGLRLAERLGYQGILDLDFRRDERGCFRLVDFNPRPGAQFRLFTDGAGLDVVQALYLDLTGQRVPEPVGGPGRVFVAENYALLAALRGPLPGPLARRGPGVVPGGAVRSAAAGAPGPAAGAAPVGGPGPEAVTGGPIPAQEAAGACAAGGPGPVREAVTGAAGGGTGARVAGPRADGPRADVPRADVPRVAGRRVPSGGAGAPGPVRAVPPAERGRVELAWFAADDVLPFLAMVAAFLGRGAGKGARGAWNTLSGVPARGRRTARAVARAPRQRGGPELPSPPGAPGPPAPPGAAEPAEPDGLVTR